MAFGGLEFYAERGENHREGRGLFAVSGLTDPGPVFPGEGERMGILSKGFYFKGKKGFETKSLSPKKVIARTLVAFAVTVALLAGALFLFKNKFIFYPRKGIELTPASIGWEFKDLFLDSVGGNKINAWHLPAPAGGETVILLHGNGGNLTEMIGRIISYRKRGFGVMAVDYQGFGLSGGSPSERAAYGDAEAAWDYLTETLGADPKKILIHGFSLGGGVASHLALAHKEHENPLVLDSTFTKIEDVAKLRGFPASWAGALVLGDEFDTLSRLPELRPSTLVVLHSPDDEIVPYELGEKIFAAYSNGPKEFVELEGGHLDFYLNQWRYAAATDRLFPSGPGAPAGAPGTEGDPNAPNAPNAGTDPKA
ncbi:MAG: alpha/beta hydrolase, partial [Deltaproteobacteria bacterium]|nr:alpha/beta hydrolase [Deltaproteobacteria bacterium]